MPPRRAGRSASRKDTPISPPKGANSSPGPIPSKRSKRSEGRELTDEDSSTQLSYRQPQRHKRLGLSTVGEEHHVIDPVLQNLGGDGQGGDVVDEPSADDISSSDSDHTSFSHAAFAKLDRDAMLDALPDLLTDSTALLSFFTNAKINLHELRTEILASQSRQAKRLSTLRDRFGHSIEAFQPELFIDLQACRPRLVNAPYGRTAAQEVPDPLVLLYLANTAKLVFHALTVELHTEAADELLEAMFLNFPDLFVAGGAQPDHDFNTLTFQLQLEFRTQYLLSHLRRARQKGDVEPDQILHDAFYDDHVPLRRLGSGDEDGLPGVYQDMFAQRVAAIRKHFKTKGNFVNWASLEKAFPWSGCLGHLVDWSKLQQGRLRVQIDEQGGVDAIQEYLQNLPAQSGGEDEESGSATITYTAPRPDGGHPTRQSPVKARKKAGNVLGDQPKKLQERLARVQAQKAAAQAQKAAAQAATPSAIKKEREEADVERPASPVIADSDSGAPNEDDQIARRLRLASEVRQPIRPTQQTATILQVKRSHELQSNKEKLGQDRKSKARAAFVDRQPGARKLGWDDTQVVAGPSTAPARPPVQRKRQANAKVDEDDEDEDEDEDAFENDGRPTMVKRPRKALLQDGGDALDDFRADAEDNDEPRVATLPRSAPQAQRSQPAPDRPASSAPPERAPSLSAATPRRHFTAIARPAQQRVAYSHAETTRLIRLIEEHGTSWSRLLELDRDTPPEEGGPQLQNRDQVQLKDKARNMKYEFIKSGVELPPNFDRVSLGNRLITKLEEQGYLHNER